MRQVVTAVVVGGLFLVAAGCGSGEKTVAEPEFGGKADLLSEVNFRGVLPFGGEGAGDFVNDFQFDAWTFEARAGAVVTIENSHLGTSASLDSTLFLYGPATGPGLFAAKRIAYDDDSGWGAHARLTGFALPEAGTYAVVLGTASGEGRGHYRITLACLSGDCSPAAPEVEGCPGDLEGWLEMCVEAAIYDDGELAQVAVEGCQDNLTDQYYDRCEYESVPPAWCRLGFESFESNIVPACVAKMTELYPPAVFPADAEIKQMTEAAVRSYLSYEDEGYNCDMRDFRFGDYTTATNDAGDVVSIEATSTARGPVNYCAAYTDWECRTQFQPVGETWSEMETDCQDIGNY